MRSRLTSSDGTVVPIAGLGAAWQMSYDSYLISPFVYYREHASIWRYTRTSKSLYHQPCKRLKDSFTILADEGKTRSVNNMLVKKGHSDMSLEAQDMGSECM